VYDASSAALHVTCLLKELHHIEGLILIERAVGFIFGRLYALFTT
jgi:hypothetical protein